MTCEGGGRAGSLEPGASLIIDAQSVLANQPATLLLASPAVHCFSTSARRVPSLVSLSDYPRARDVERPDAVVHGFLARGLAALSSSPLATSFIVYGAVYLAPGSRSQP